MQIDEQLGLGPAQVRQVQLARVGEPGQRLDGPHPAEGRALTIETVADGRMPDGMMVFSVHALDIGGKTGASLIDSRPVQLGARPATMALMDDRVAITAGSVTIVLPAPTK